MVSVNGFVSYSGTLTLVKVVFLGQLCSYGALPSAHLFHLASLYKLDKSGNAEIRTGFYEIALMDFRSSAAHTFASAAADWVTGADGSGVVKGRMKFCRQIFKYVHKVKPTLAVHAFMKSRLSFHPIARNLIEKVNCMPTSTDPFLTWLQDLKLV